MKKSPFWSQGLRFQCQGSGKCCVSRGAYGHVYLTLPDRRALAKLLAISTLAFTKRYCDKANEVWKLKDNVTNDCVFLDGKKCGVYSARPTQCRTWPFWPEVMNPRAWNQEVASFCPGVGKGKVWSAQEIEEQMRAQKESEDLYGS